MTGESATAGGSESIDTTFNLTPIEGTFLINDAYDAYGNPIGPRPGAEALIETAPKWQWRLATADELNELRFEDVTSAAGLDQPHSDRPLREGPASLTGGAAARDYDNDGEPDRFLTRVSLPNIMMRNDSGHFTDITDLDHAE